MNHGRAVAVLVVLLSGLTLRAQCPLPSFRGVAEWYGGQTPRLVTFANINGDEWPDLVVGSFGSTEHPEGGIVVLAGDGGRSWAVQQELVPAQNIELLAAADFDGDGDDDDAYFQAGTTTIPDTGHRIRVLMNDRGTLAQKSVFAVAPAPGGTPRHLFAGDFNGDDRMDLLYAAEVTILYLGRGDGTFEEKSIAAPAVIAAAVEDLDHDGDHDAILSFLDGSMRRVGWFSFDAQGVATLRKIYSTGIHATVLAIADSDGDGAYDLLASDGSQFYRVFFSAAEQGGGTFSQYLSEARWNTPPVVADFDRNGTADLGFHTFTHGFRYVHGVGPGGGEAVTTPGVWVPRLEFHTDEDGGMDAADVDRDGDVDVALATNYGFAVLKNDGAGNFDAPRFATWIWATGDFNNDGRDDLVEQEGAILRVRLAGPGGTFEQAGLGITQEARYTYVNAGDFNGDGNLDLLTFFDTGFPDGHAEVRLGNGDGTFDEPGEPAAVTEPMDDRVLADFDGDANLDVLIVTFASDSKFILLHGDGAGGFSHRTVQTADSFISRAVAGDLDGDGDVDLVLGTANRPDEMNLLVAYNDGHGMFGTPVQVGLYFGYDLELADLTGDGRLDIMTAGEFFPIPLYRNDGGGTFTPVGGLLPELNADPVLHARDFNRDGYVDLLIIEEGGTTAGEGWMLLYLGNGDATFREPVRMRTYGAFRNAVGDFNGDGVPDFLDGGLVRLNTCIAARHRGVRH